jgi:ATP sulfurylase
MIKPHGSDELNPLFVYNTEERNALIAEAENLPSILLNSAAAHTAYSKKLNKVVMMRDAPDHDKDDFVLLSGTAVREMLGQGIAPPPEFSRPEVARILSDYYQSLEG